MFCHKHLLQLYMCYYQYKICNFTSKPVYFYPTVKHRKNAFNTFTELVLWKFTIIPSIPHLILTTIMPRNPFINLIQLLLPICITNTHLDNLNIETHILPLSYLHPTFIIIIYNQIHIKLLICTPTFP